MQTGKQKIDFFKKDFEEYMEKARENNDYLSKISNGLKEFMSFYAKSKIRGETTIILLQSTDAPANRDRYSFISNIARKHISLENSMNRRFT